MSKLKDIFVCQNCGYESLKLWGRCPSCQAWNSFQEVKKAVKSKASPAGAPAPSAVFLHEIELGGQKRLQTSMSELDRVLGGGLVPGSVVLVGGDPGIGKSTLLLQLAALMSEQELKTLYVTGEESPRQLKLRATRLGLEKSRVLVLAETNYEQILSKINDIKPLLLVIDSIQTVYKPEVESVPGSISQIREVTSSLVQLAKSNNMATLIVGHVTKDGVIAGPRLLEHMVDCVLYFEGERYQNYRILRSVKNRFGSTNEMGIFCMEDKGLSQVDNPSAFFLSANREEVAGSVVTASMEGSRPFMVEIQGLVTPGAYGGNPRRVVTGLDSGRLALILAVLEKRVGLHLQDQDVFVNVVGGVKLMEPAVDLALALSLVSSFRDKPVRTKDFAVGEIGLTGEIRPVQKIEERIWEGAKLGFGRCILPTANYEKIRPDKIKKLPGDFELVPVDQLSLALELIVEK